MLTFLGPLVVLPFSRSLAVVIFVLAVVRLIVWGVYLAMCLRILPELRKGVDVRRHLSGRSSDLDPG